jgi:hypothetical protein
MNGTSFMFHFVQSRAAEMVAVASDSFKTTRSRTA